MGYIKEPKGADFIIQSKPLTDEERKEISKFIQDYKANNEAKSSATKSKNFFIKTKNVSLTKKHTSVNIRLSVMPAELSQH